MFQHKILYLLAAACLAFAAPALGAKPTSGGGSSIAIATVDGSGMAALAPAPTPKLGNTLTFATRVEPLAGWEYPMVALSCYQDVNGDGTVDTNLLGPDIVFSQLGKPSATFTLGGYSSIWTQRGGGNAVCRAELDAYGWKGGRQSIRVLATTGNWAAQG
jgi:hypothetical protein